MHGALLLASNLILSGLQAIAPAGLGNDRTSLCPDARVMPAPESLEPLQIESFEIMEFPGQETTGERVASARTTDRAVHARARLRVRGCGLFRAEWTRNKHVIATQGFAVPCAGTRAGAADVRWIESPFLDTRTLESFTITGEARPLDRETVPGPRSAPWTVRVEPAESVVAGNVFLLPTPGGHFRVSNLRVERKNDQWVGRGLLQFPFFRESGRTVFALPVKINGWRTDDSGKVTHGTFTTELERHMDVSGLRVAWTGLKALANGELRLKLAFTWDDTLLWVERPREPDASATQTVGDDQGGTGSRRTADAWGLEATVDSRGSWKAETGRLRSRSLVGTGVRLDVEKLVIDMDRDKEASVRIVRGTLEIPVAPPDCRRVRVEIAGWHLTADGVTGSAEVASGDGAPYRVVQVEARGGNWEIRYLGFDGEWPGAGLVRGDVRLVVKRGEPAQLILPGPAHADVNPVF